MTKNKDGAYIYIHTYIFDISLK